MPVDRPSNLGEGGWCAMRWLDWPKRCSRCGQVKSSREFHRDPTKPDGLYGQCRACKNAAASSPEARARETRRFNREFRRVIRQAFQETLKKGVITSGE